MHPAPLLAYPSGLGNPKVALQSIKKGGDKRQSAPVGENAPLKKKNAILA